MRRPRGIHRETAPGREAFRGVLPNDMHKSRNGRTLPAILVDFQIAGLAELPIIHVFKQTKFHAAFPVYVFVTCGRVVADGCYCAPSPARAQPHFRALYACTCPPLNMFMNTFMNLFSALFRTRQAGTCLLSIVKLATRIG